MPYTYPNDVPDFIKGLPEGAQKLFITVFNASIKEGKSEDDSRIAGWGAVKNKYEKQGEDWVAKSTEFIHAIQLIEVPAEGVKSEIQVLRTGKFYHPLYGEFTVTDATLQKMQENFGKVRPISPTEMVIDYDHLAADPKTPDQGKAAGWFKSLRAVPGKLFATVEWTADAAKAIKEKLFRFISPEFTFDYTDKTTGKKVGPVLVSACLTNRPFLEGMEPVVLSEGLSAMVFKENCIGCIRTAEWDTQYINDLPDSCFAYVKPGGAKDESGRTTPRDLRMLPYKNVQGAVDMAHLRNALSRLEQTDLSDEDKARARKVLESAAEKAGVGEHREQSPNSNKEDTKLLDEKKLREVLVIGETDDVMKVITTLKANEATLTAQVSAEKSRADKADLKLKESEVLVIVDKALADQKITPKMREWAAAYAMKDPEGFKAYVEKAEKVGPDLKVKGHEGEMDTIALTDLEKTIAQKLNVSEDKLLAAKKEAAAKR